MAIEIAANTANFNKALQQSNAHMTTFTKGVTGAANSIKNVLVGALAGFSIATLGKQVIDVTASFQKFNAVLTNTLGSSNLAKIALRDIEIFAARTPFAVDELTSSFVKLANQGFVPTTNELRKLGDLASSTGKGFDQLAEAIIDAQTGEFERLKEFGIRAKKQGDQVTFSFKGVETQTRFTSEAIREYILSLGDAEGVTGAMAAISETLGGQISNLGDSWTQFLKVIGDGNKGPLSAAIGGLSQLLKAATDFAKTPTQRREEQQTDAQSKAIEELKELVKSTGDLSTASDQLIKKLETQKQIISDSVAPLFKYYDANEEVIEIEKNKAAAIEAQILAIKDYVKAEEDRATKEAESAKKTVDSLKKVKKAREEAAPPTPGSVAAYRKEIAALSAELDNVNTKDLSRIRILSGQIAAYEEVVKRIESLKNSFKDIGIVIPAPDTTAIYNALEIDKGLTDRFKERMKEISDTAKRTTSEIKEGFEGLDLSGLLANALGGIGEAFGSAIAGTDSLGKLLLGVLGGILKQFGGMLITVGAGIIAAKKAFQSLNGYVAIAAGVALVALGSYFSSATKNLGNSMGGGGGGGSSTSSGSTRVQNQDFGREIKFNAEFTIHGNDLKAIANNQANKSGRLG